MKKIRKIILCVVTSIVMLFTSVPSYACEGDNFYEEGMEIYKVDLPNGISFVLYRNDCCAENEGSIFSTKRYTSDTYTGNFYFTESEKQISHHVFTAYFSYDGTMASCYDTSTDTTYLDDDSAYKPEVTDEGKNNVSSTQVYGYVTITLYDPNGNACAEVSVKIYCNQDGDTWVNRQG